MTSSSSSFEIRLFYVRISPCSIDTVPSSLTLSHLRRPIGVCLEINGAKIPSSDHTSLLLRRDRIDRETSEVTYVSTDGVKLTGAVDFEVFNDKGNLILCGSLEKMEAAWSNGSIGSCGDKDPKTGWSMDCYLAASLQPKLGIVSPLIEVYVAGCFGGVPLILTQTVQLSPRRKARPGALDAIPEDEESWERANARTDGGLVCRRSTATGLWIYRRKERFQLINCFLMRRKECCLPLDLMLAVDLLPVLTILIREMLLFRLLHLLESLLIMSG